MDKDAKDQWKTAFKVVLREERTHEGDMGGVLIDYWEVRDHNDNLVGTYRDQDYAVKQARRKYKKLVRLIERSLMS